MKTPASAINNFNAVYQKLVSLGAKSIYPNLPEINQIFDFDRSKHPNAVGLATLEDVNDDNKIDIEECKYDLGGYFIINGSEKVIVSQERRAENKIYICKN